MFCRKCGKEVPDDSEFCFSCGERVALFETNHGNPPVQGRSTPKKKYDCRCPECGSDDLRESTRYVGSKMQYFFQCERCHHEFRRRIDIVESIGTYEASIKKFLLGLVFEIIGMICLNIGMSENNSDPTVVNILLIVSMSLSLVAIFFMSLSRSQAQDELYKFDAGQRRNVRKQSAYTIRNIEKTNETAGWTCSECGRTNAIYVGTCACGKRKDKC